MRSELPTGIASFETIRENDFYYVDKTKFVLAMTRRPWESRVFTRPRRFGKSLLLNTIQCLYEGKQKLFEGLYIYDKWDWEKEHPVIKLDLSTVTAKSNAIFCNDLAARYASAARKHGVTISSEISPGGQLSELIELVYEKEHKKVVLLVDEYDAPLICARNFPDEYQPIHQDMRGILSAIKAHRDIIEFVLITGILKLDQHDFFSAANIFEDVSFKPEFNEMCGYTERELLDTFAPELEREDLNPEINIDSLREWYDGYRWGGPTHIYNPNDVLYTFKNNRIASYWTQFGLATVAVNMIKKIKDFSFEHYTTEMNLLSIQNGIKLEKVELDTILFQTGYLTIKSPYEEKSNLDRLVSLEPPNLEVKKSLAELRFSIQSSNRLKENTFDTLRTILREHQFEKLESKIRDILSKLVYDDKPEELRECHFAMLMQSMFTACGLENVQREVHTSEGRADLVVKTGQTHYVMEFKVLGIADNKRGCAMAQLKEKNYASRYKEEGDVFILGFEFTVTGIEGEKNSPKVTLAHLDWEEVL